MRTEPCLLTNGAKHVKGVNTILVYLHDSPYLTLHTIFYLPDAKLQHALRPLSLGTGRSWQLPQSHAVTQIFMWFSVLCSYRFRLERLQFARLDRDRLEGFPN